MASLIAVDAGLVQAQDLRREPVARGIAQVHPQQLGGEQGGFLATRAGPDLEDDVAVVVRVARQEQHLELLEQAGLVGLEPVDLLAGHRPHLLVAVARVAQLARAGELGRGSTPGADRPRRSGSSRASSLPSRRIWFGSALTSGRDSSAWRSSYWRAISASLASRSLMAVGGGSSGRGRLPTGRRPARACRRHRVAPSARGRSRSEPAGICVPVGERAPPPSR